MHILTYPCLVLLPLVHSIMIHQLMTPDEILGIFHTTHDTVPYYEFVPVLYSTNALNENGTLKMHIESFNQTIELRLNHTEGYLASENTPVWSVKSDKEAPEGLQYTLIPNALKDIGSPLQDEETGAALLVSFQNNKLPIFDGFLSSNLVIRSLPERIIKNDLYKKHGLFKPHFGKKLKASNFVHTYYHIVYQKVPLDSNKGFKITNPVSRVYRIPNVIYPEVLVTVDYTLYLMLGGTIQQAKRYIIAFWNGIDLIYRTLINPKVRINIAGIIIAMDEQAIPYIGRSRINSKLVDADRALRNMGAYFYSEKRFPWKIYDMAIATTKLDLCNKLDDYLCDPSTLGYAYVAGACNRNHTTKSSQAVGLAEDNGGFSGTIPVAHELGHLLGAYHDGNPKELGNCSSYDDFIMAGTLTLSKNEFEWSNCSMNAFHKFLSEDKAKCLYDEPPKASAIRRLLPGKLMSVDEQCEKVFGGGTCNKNLSTICYRLNCEVPQSHGLCAAIAAAAEGSTCGTGLICLNGNCVLEGTEIKDESSYTLK